MKVRSTDREILLGCQEPSPKMVVLTNRNGDLAMKFRDETMSELTLKQ